jgi:dipeptidyl-peptidase 4
LNRHQSQVKYHLVTNPETPTDRIFYEEETDTYLDADNVILLKDGASMLRTSEKDGYNHIYHLTFDGKLSQVTSGNWDIIDLYGIDEKKGTVFYSSSENGAINKSLYSISFKQVQVQTPLQPIRFAIAQEKNFKYWNQMRIFRIS